MANAWEQIWNDLRASLFGKSPEIKPEQPEKIADGRDLTDIEEEKISEKISDPPTSVQTEAGETPSLIDGPTGEILPGEDLFDENQDEVGINPFDTDKPEGGIGGALETADQKSKRGSLIIGIVLAVGVILILYGGPWLSKLTAPEPPAENVIATFDGGQITIADVESHIIQLVPEELSFIAQSPDVFISTIEHLVIEELVLRWAAQRQPDADEDFRHTIQHINEDLNLQSFEAQLHEGDIAVTESEIQAYYNANRDLFGDQSLNEVREQVRQTLVYEQEEGYISGYTQKLKDNASITRSFELLESPTPTEDDLRRFYDDNRDQFTLPRQAIVDELQFPVGEEVGAARKDADDALLKIRGGTPFEEISQVVPRALTSLARTVFEGSADPAWEVEVFALTAAELSDVFQVGNGFYIIRLQEIQPAGIQPFTVVRPLIMDTVSQQKAEIWFQDNSNQTLFTINGRRYSLGQFYKEYKELPPSVQFQYGGAEGMKEMAEELIERLLLIEDTYNQLLNVENQDLATEARLQVLQQMLHQEEIDDKIKITDEEIQDFYDGNIAMMSTPPQMRIRYIRIGMGTSEDELTLARSKIHEAYAKLVPGLFKKGEDFSLVAMEYSEDPETAAAGGELAGWIGESTDIIAELDLHSFHEKILDLPTGEISSPFEFDGSLYIVQVIERTTPELLTIEDVRPYIEEVLNSQKHDQLLIELQNRLLEDANVVIYSKVVDDYLDQLKASITPNP